MSGDYSERKLTDGIYDVTGLKSIIINIGIDCVMKDIKSTQYKQYLEFTIENPEYVICSAYETDETILLNKRPEKFNGKIKGSGFNYGSTTIIQNCPKDILILAEND
jgi:hypothetical protein